ncbi:MAG: cupin domain-containing protein [Sphingomonas sp.]
MALHHAISGEIVHLSPLNTPSTRTAALVKSPAFEAIHLVVKAGETIPAHHVDGTMTLYCIEGAVAVDVDGEAVEMRTHDWLYLDPHVPHALRGLADSGLLLTILFDPAAAGLGRRGDA